MTVLVTGGGGFVGLNVVEELIAAGDRVIVLDRRPLPAAAERSFGERIAEIEVVVADIRDTETLRGVFSEFNIQRVVHTAVITSNAAREASEPNTIIDVNLRGTVSVLEAARAAACERVIYVSSGQAYGKTHDEGAPLLEEISPSRPEDIYGITKFAAEQSVLRLATLWQFQVVCVRLGSVCGPWEVDTGVRDMLSPQLQVAKLAARGETALLPGHEFWRDWVYSRDVAAGLVSVLKAAHLQHRLYHLSSGLDWGGSFAGWCRILKDTYPRFNWRIASNAEEPNVHQRIARDRSPMDITRIAKDVGFKPLFGPKNAYDDYIDWIRRHQDFISN